MQRSAEIWPSWQYFGAENQISRLDWLVHGDLSLRAYRVSSGHGPRPCVSTRSTELIVMLDGELGVEMGADRQQYRLRPGQAAWIQQGTPHQTHCAPGTRFLVVDYPAHMGRPLGLARRVRLPAREVVQLDAALGRRQEPRPARLQQLVAPWRSRGADGDFQPMGEGQHTWRMVRVKAHLERHYAEPIQMRAVAERFGLDRYYLLRAFKKSFGVTPLSYVLFLRNEHFVWALLHGGAQHRLLELALAAGFGDYATFCRRFRQTFGRPPSRLSTRPGQEAKALVAKRVARSARKEGAWAAP